LNSICFPAKKSFFPIINSPLGRTNALVLEFLELISSAIFYFVSIVLSLFVVGTIVVVNPNLFNLLRIS